MRIGGTASIVQLCRDTCICYSTGACVPDGATNYRGGITRGSSRLSYGAISPCGFPCGQPLKGVARRSVELWRIGSSVELLSSSNDKSFQSSDQKLAGMDDVALLDWRRTCCDDATVAEDRHLSRAHWWDSFHCAALQRHASAADARKKGGRMGM
ncbi:hypothetical protein Syun_000614 [Stephania yunnanensis]|uniref:Uncharacterized protein n=1 Tax=Stephania yunnanensis TaxID=152371 RepID=A0AAP0Q6Y2_9MAGN